MQKESRMITRKVAKFKIKKWNILNQNLQSRKKKKKRREGYFGVLGSVCRLLKCWFLVGIPIVKMEAIRSPETSVSFSREDRTLDSHRRENVQFGKSKEDNNNTQFTTCRPVTN
jgi:hypothetical protein